MNEQQYLESVMKPLLTHPEALKITRTVDERGVLLEVDAHQEDMGRVIGRAGATAGALRRLLRQFGATCNSNVSMRVKEPPGSTHRRRDQLEEQA